VFFSSDAGWFGNVGYKGGGLWALGLETGIAAVNRAYRHYYHRLIGEGQAKIAG
jgi:hypothetical protein